MRLKDKFFLITGASGGIGEASAYALAAIGARPILVARREDELERVAANIHKRYGLAAACITADICLAQDRQRILRKIEEHNELHLLIHNAGITAHGAFGNTRPEVLRQTMEINFFAAVELTALLLPTLQKTHGQKAIVLISSPSGLYGIPYRFAYSASKAAGHAWLQTLSVELYADNITTHIFCPGYTRTNLRASGLAADGSRLQSAQAANAHEPAEVARRLLRQLKRNKRITTTNLAGCAVYWLRVLAPGLLEKLLRKKVKDDE